MELIFWWLLIVWVMAITAYWVIRYYVLARRKRKQAAAAFTLVAHTTRLTGLDEYVKALKRYRLLLRWTTGLLTVSLLLAIVLSARPARVSSVLPEQKSRDIMLCLDASGSVLKEDTMLFDRFSTLVTEFSGQRFGVTLFNSSAVTIIPLNDNYPLITQQLKTDAQAFRVQKGATFTQLTNGTLAGFASGTSLVSDGLTSCIEHMNSDGNGQHRSQSIILATDNEVNGTPVVSMSQAIASARQLNVHVFAIDPGISDTKLAGDHAQLKIVTSQTGGNYYQLSDNDVVGSIISNINSQKTEDFVGLAQPAVNDNPKWFVCGLAMLSLASMALVWRLEL
jgi:Ca-activated chloride channel family protein